MYRIQSIALYTVFTVALVCGCSDPDSSINEPVPQEADYTEIRDFYVHIQGDLTSVSGSGDVDEAFNVTNFVFGGKHVRHDYPWIVRNYSYDFPIPKTGARTYSHDTMIVRNPNLWCKERTEIRVSEDGTMLELLYQRYETFAKNEFGWESRVLKEVKLNNVPFDGPWNSTNYMRCFITAGNTRQIASFANYEVTDYLNPGKQPSISLMENPRIDSGFVDIGIRFAK